MLFCAKYKIMITTKIYNSTQLPQEFEKDKMIDFLFDNLQQYGDPKDAIKKAKEIRDRPVFIIANTVKGKGVSFMENNPKWHSGGLTDEEYKKAVDDINVLGGNNE